MKKFLYYIVFALSLVNPPAISAGEAWQNEAKTVEHLRYHIANSAPLAVEPEEAPRPKAAEEPLIRSNNEFAALLLLPFLADKLYPGEEINKNAEFLLKKIYPQTSESTIKALASFLKAAVTVKRRYEYVIKKLEHKIKADSLLPKDALPIAEDGEYAPFAATKRKKSPAGTYNVSYTPYKYLEYDIGELGEPVRRRNKNYTEKATENDEIILALLKFDIPAFVRALQKRPAANDGSAEKPGEFAKGVSARLLLALSEPGFEPCIKAGIEVKVPKGYYIDGDILTPQARPRFDLSEDNAAPANIKSYRIFNPETIGVVKAGVAKRILIGRVLFPAEFCRADVEKPLNIKGSFTFSLCRADGKCAPFSTAHELSLAPSENHTMSLYNNYIIQAHAELPPETNKKARVKNAVYDKKRQKLTVTFALNSPAAAIAVQAEDGAKTNFINPAYGISADTATATFDITPKKAPASTDSPGTAASLSDSLAIAAGAPVAITASFDDANVIRAVITPAEEADSSLPAIPPASLLHLFLLGLIINLMPGAFSQFCRLIRAVTSLPEQGFAIIMRYAASTLAALIFIGFFWQNQTFQELSENPYLAAIALIISASFLMESLSYMDFALFRPFKGIMRRGILAGLFTVIMLSALPACNTAVGITEILQTPPAKKISLITALWLGLLTLPVIAFSLRKRLNIATLPAKTVNAIYNAVAIAVLLWLAYAYRGLIAAVIFAISASLTAALWYLYPLAIQETVRHTRSNPKKQQLFFAVQKHCAIALIVIYAVTALPLAFIPLKTPEVPSAAAVTRKIKENIKENRPTLVMLTADWSLNSLISRYAADRMVQAGLEVIKIPAFGAAGRAAALPYLKTYAKKSPPLHILYTKRHEKGLVLPDNLRRFDWETAVAPLPGTAPQKTPRFPLTIQELNQELNRKELLQ